MLVVQSPLRVSLFGGGTDFPSYFEHNGGCALTTTINRYIFIIIRPRMDSRIRISCTHIQTVDNVRNIKHELIREAMRKTGMPGGVEIVTIGDVPAGTGLGSSSAVTVGLLRAMYTNMREDASMERLALEACEIERDILKKPIGVQDQYIAAYGGLRFLEFKESGVVVENVEINNDVRRKLNDRLLLFYTGITRSSSDILTEQKARVSSNNDLLTEMKEIAYTAINELKRGTVDAVGPLLDASWRLKRKLATTITSKKIEGLYKRGIDAGATGGKITGAGGGGFLLFYCPEGSKEAVREGLKELKELPFAFEPDGAKVIFNYKNQYV